MALEFNVKYRCLNLTNNLFVQLLLQSMVKNFHETIVDSCYMYYTVMLQISDL